MKAFALSLVFILISMGILDFIWLNSMYSRFYSHHVGHLLSSSLNGAAAISFYLLFAFGLAVFVVFPGITSLSYTEVFLKGLLFGLVTYGTYDLTNQATLERWPTIVTIVDMLWGSVLTATVSLFSVYFTRFFLSH